MANSTKLSYVPDSSPGAGDVELGVRVRGVHGTEVGDRRGDLVGELGGVGPVGDPLGVGADQGVEVDERQALDRRVLGRP